MSKLKLNVNETNGFQPLINLEGRFEIIGEFNNWVDEHFVTKVPIKLIQSTNSDHYYNIFHANYCENHTDNIDHLQIHVAVMPDENNNNDQLVYEVEKPSEYFNLNPKDSNALVEVEILIYDLDERCPEDKQIYMCKEYSDFDEHPLKDELCKKREKALIGGVEIQPETKKGAIIIGG